jgi:diguanylate cyclase
MKYVDSVERSAELLRMALPLMSRQLTALHPISYAVWYEYVAQTNPPLRAAVDAAMGEHGSLDEARTRSIFRRHVMEIDPDTAERVSDGFERVLSGMSETASRAGSRTAQYGRSLERLREVLAPEAAPLAREVIDETQHMIGAIAQLQQELAESRREIEDLRVEVRRARHESLVDALTGLANRRAFDQQVAACLAGADAAAAETSLIVSDVDHFKRINDSYGHAFGDQVLQAIGKVLQAIAPPQALVARIGGEEFALLLPGLGAAAASQVAERARATIAGSRVRRGAEPTPERVTVSLGVACSSPGESPQALLARADEAMYASKRGGRDRVCVAA